MSLDSTHRGIPAAAPPPDAHADRLKFNGDNSFHRELRRRVDAEFKRSGTRQRDSAQMYLKTAIILGVFALAYVALVFLANTWWQGLLLGLVLGIATAAIGFNIMHDGGHQAYSERRWVNRLMALALDLVGGSSYIWQWKHARFHHTWVNVAGHDSDIDLGVLGRLSPQQPRRPWHRWQHLYLWPLYGVTAIRWHLYGDFRDMLTGTVGERPFDRPKGWDLAGFVIGKLVFFTLAFGLPLAFHPLGTVLLFYALVSAVAGVLLALVFQMAHVVEEAAFPLPDASGRQMEAPWAIHQLQTTVDFARGNRVLGWLIGGLNFQVEHHLFPRISHVHYPLVARVVEDTCREFGVTYREHRTFGAGIASHYRLLRRLGQSAAASVPALTPA
ncbi:linoleoyl-CoA desaturase [Rhodanobacter sp. Soil772]|uniref:fatty acid desaturase family protein n=1 Tax=Rhodanobacter sp. Soil772 TaxID=1736406 RepID=UPI0006F3553C|nr:acyl-CoA desaturase [Rhodanobacter sp. Soil772]KRE84657.1 linoleoyl-CoA desaturase [Rhodanobacter sp. Soil772]